jgi:hypothetical protein
MSALRTLLATAALLIAVLCTARASAQDATPTPEDDAVARSLFDDGRRALDAGRPEDALAAFRSAFALSGRVEMLYNVGVAAQRARRRAEALSAFRAYLERAPEVDNAAEVRSRIVELEELLAASRVHDAGPGLGAPPRTLSARPRRDDTAPWTLTAVGSVLAAIGVAVLVIALVDVASVEGAPDGASWSSRSDAYGRAPVLSAIGIVTACVGLVAALAGVTWLAWPGWPAGPGAI